MYAEKEEICPAYVSEHNSDCKKQFLLMIPNEEGWHCLAVKKISALLRGIMSTHHGDFYWPNCLHSFAIQNKRDSHEKAWESKDFCNVAMPSEDTC